MQEEIWRPLVCQDIHEGWYEVSNIGRVRTAKTKRLLSPFNSKGYLRIGLITYTRGQQKFPVHRLVANAFVEGRTHEKRFVNHIDGNKLNNVYTNLEWVTASENIIHAIRTGLRHIIRGERNGQATISEKQAHELCQLLIDNHGDVVKTYNDIKDTIKNISTGMLYHLRNKGTWLHVSDLYFYHEDFDETDPYHNNVVSFSYNGIHYICETLTRAAINLSRLTNNKISIRDAHEALLRHEFTIADIDITYHLMIDGVYCGKEDKYNARVV